MNDAIERRTIDLKNAEDVLPLVQDRLISTQRTLAGVEGAIRAVPEGAQPDPMLEIMRTILSGQELILGALFHLVQKGTRPGLSLVQSLPKLPSVR